MKYEVEKGVLDKIWDKGCEETKEKIQEAIPEYERYEGWEDITGESGMERNGSWGVCLKGQRGSGTGGGFLLVMPNGTKWDSDCGTSHLMFKVSGSRLWRKKNK